MALYLNGRGIVKERQAAVGQRGKNPVADNSTADGSAGNRRVEMTLDAIS